LEGGSIQKGTKKNSRKQLGSRARIAPEKPLIQKRKRGGKGGTLLMRSIGCVRWIYSSESGKGREGGHWDSYDNTVRNSGWEERKKKKRENVGTHSPTLEE